MNAMTKNCGVMIGGIAMLLLSAVASAQEQDGYFGGNFSIINYEEDFLSNLSLDGDSKLSLKAINGILGYSFTPNLSAEARIGFGAGKDSFTDGSFTYVTSIDTLVGAYLKAQLDTGSGINPYLILGFTEVLLEVEITELGFSATDDDSDTSFGVGILGKINDGSQWSLEYMNYYDKEGVEITGINLGALAKF